jgi:hypothetical protein
LPFVHLAALAFEHQKVAARGNAYAPARLLGNVNPDELGKSIDCVLPLHSQSTGFACLRIAAFGGRNLNVQLPYFAR